MTHTWKVVVHLFDADDVDPHRMVTTAHAVLTTSAGTSVDGFGRATRNPDDLAVTEIGQELATARALRDVADQLLRATSEDIGAIEHRTVLLPR